MQERDRLTRELAEAQANLASDEEILTRVNVALDGLSWDEGGVVLASWEVIANLRQERDTLQRELAEARTSQDNWRRHSLALEDQAKALQREVGGLRERADKNFDAYQEWLTRRGQGKVTDAS